MAKNSTIENRVYLFDTLAGALLSGPVGELLASSEPADRERAMRALSDAAWVSCVVADGADVGADEVRARLLGASPEGKRRKKRDKRESAEDNDD
jgi:hypothetical protein